MPGFCSPIAMSPKPSPFRSLTRRAPRPFRLGPHYRGSAARRLRGPLLTRDPFVAGLWLTGVTDGSIMNPMTKTQVYLREEELAALHQVARRSGRSVAELVREAIRRVWLRPGARGPVALWSGPVKRTSVEHDSIYDEP
jgi:hypothetical protein